MRKRNSVAQLNRTHSHRKAMMRNMATSLFEHERIITTRAKSKAIRGYAEKLITRAKGNLAEGVSDAKALHNKREVMKHIKDRSIVVKLFEDLAPRFKDRSGGYTRIIHLPERKSDSAEMSIIELVDRKERVRKERTKTAATTKSKDSSKDDKATDTTASGDDKNQGKWYDRFRRKKRGNDYQG